MDLGSKPADGDPALKAIPSRSKAGERIDFAWLMERYGTDNDEHLHALLDRGRTVPNTVPLLNQYLKSYGNMVASQWRYAAQFMPLFSGPVRWIDYGCGQGIAGLLLSESIGPALFEQVSHIVLIEPSALALARATSLYRHLAPESTIETIQARFDDVTARALRFFDRLDTVHIFSNVLDVPGFDACALLDKALGPGHHLLLALSNDRSVAGGTERVLAVKRAVEHPGVASRSTLNWSRYERFTCDTRNRAGAVLWFCGLDMHHG